MSFCPCPTTILPLLTRTRLMLPCIRPCCLTIELNHNADVLYTRWRAVMGLFDADGVGDELGEDVEEREKEP